ncbi:MAG: DUF2299 family protein [Methanothermobacter sp.]|uniref:DUF2299 domain-containing protein n=1 Tax=Methanothermobacter tenebrarum TaxID=680118 RepID=UPI0020C0DF84|nr:DUF2299 family protein [Methanothermobacter tenebrarum]MDD3454325.1 DUF2299 family protein [Methanobacteriales archaeon]MDI6882722.1 DUF2299 family protein [Methanothermobacter sp.]MDX9693613.1 DUF2299 family protein [Methanothermobacter sp.]HOQ19661.1 DUF2299 family protein [Methanothermobacter sp.]
MIILEGKIKRWLTEEGLLGQIVDDENANFHFIVNYPEEHVIDVIQPKGKRDLVLVACATSVSPEHLSKIQELSESKREEFLWQIRFSLNKFLVDFQLEHPRNILESYLVTDEIYNDALTKDRLISTIKKVFKAKLHVLWLIQKRFGEKKEEIHEDTMYV